MVVTLTSAKEQVRIAKDGLKAALTEVQPGVISDDLRRAADRFVDLAKVISVIGRKPGERRHRRVAADGGQ